MTRLWASPWTWVVALGGIGGFDAWLMLHGYPSLSNWAGLHPVVAGLGCGGLFLHFNTHRFGIGGDPLNMVGAWLRARSNP